MFKVTLWLVVFPMILFFGYTIVKELMDLFYSNNDNTSYLVKKTLLINLYGLVILILIGLMGNAYS